MITFYYYMYRSRLILMWVQWLLDLIDTLIITRYERVSQNSQCSKSTSLYVKQSVTSNTGAHITHTDSICAAMFGRPRVSLCCDEYG
jgi:hypothetical protein